jgi:hypothetical protein
MSARDGGMTQAMRLCVVLLTGERVSQSSILAAKYVYHPYPHSMEDHTHLPR